MLRVQRQIVRRVGLRAFSDKWAERETAYEKSYVNQQDAKALRHLLAKMKADADVSALDKLQATAAMHIGRILGHPVSASTLKKLLEWKYGSL
ncbi:hypothetical protein SDRG_01144 [Saprolegnia diclina VS20]|uniref:Uncharacterized protein n=1 Tax=Saprolegnia diclina (strain VS20) TaxID=1156394 RepID=T0SE55_SAPDV|nr:hypothetical protein SDRG_01144 [Saprolegnia diclina VS20]EQC41167.1 hypothetical protein SDRG_01144 [Saprolegnia diclina VS20]|eukprot:XP_008604881.1 hypothetical protein SDRG_01144 [Saprolegnia diclina VS20]